MNFFFFLVKFANFIWLQVYESDNTDVRIHWRCWNALSNGGVTSRGQEPLRRCCWFFVCSCWGPSPHASETVGERASRVACALCAGRLLCWPRRSCLIIAQLLIEPCHGPSLLWEPVEQRRTHLSQCPDHICLGAGEPVGAVWAKTASCWEDPVAAPGPVSLKSSPAPAAGCTSSWTGAWPTAGRRGPGAMPQAIASSLFLWRQCVVWTVTVLPAVWTGWPPAKNSWAAMTSVKPLSRGPILWVPGPHWLEQAVLFK